MQGAPLTSSSGEKGCEHVMAASMCNSKVLVITQVIAGGVRNLGRKQIYRIFLVVIAFVYHIKALVIQYMKTAGATESEVTWDLNCIWYFWKTS